MFKSMRATAAFWSNRDSSPTLSEEALSHPKILDQASFLRALYLEQKRTERSRRRFVLMLLESQSLLMGGDSKEVLGQILDALSHSTRETDVTGWYKNGSVIGFIFTEIGQVDGKSVAKALLTKISSALSNSLSIDQINQIHISFHVYPEDWSDPGNGRPAEPVLHPDFTLDGTQHKGPLLVKRLIDVAGSIAGLILFSPLLAVIAALVWLTSKGPILFRQQRVGQYGRRFTFLKFRSMHVGNNHAIHEEFVKRFIAGDKDPEEQPSPRPVYKLTKDPRLTSIGGFLRKTSLDELPQFFNVLMGDMSLVGPRPPVPYEVNRYDVWHRRRLLAVKPGITGLWQVTGRSTVTFDEMVRLDLKYARTWSLQLDLKILLQTPRAVLGGEGAY
jgi:lipopolysaccharide/colanic/teichoic acid biosynthesis glycosyltransferase